MPPSVRDGLHIKHLTFHENPHILAPKFASRSNLQEVQMAYTIIDTCIGCTACVKRCPTDAISGVRNELHVIDPNLCIDCGACGVVCPPESILDETGDQCRGFQRKEWPKAVVIEDNCIGSGPRARSPPAP